MEENRLNFVLGVVLVIYLLVVGIGAAVVLIINFPTQESGVTAFPYTEGTNPRFVPFGNLGSIEQGLILIAMLAGVAGSFLHAAQSLASYLGNADFKASWTAWYFLRPWIGGILGLAIYFAFRAGLVGGASVVNPYGVVALGLLGGWFSKTTTDKLQEVFETLFKTDQDKLRKDKLRVVDRPVVEGVDPPSPVPAGTGEITINGRNFLQGATVLFDGEELKVRFVSDHKLKLSVSDLPRPPRAGTKALIQVKNPEGLEPVSKGLAIEFT